MGDGQGKGLVNGKMSGQNRQKPRLWVSALVWMLLVVLPGPATMAWAETINLNTATVEQLQSLPFIGEVRARAIVEYRRQQGPFVDFADLLESEAVGPRTLEAIRPYLSINGERQGVEVDLDDRGREAGGEPTQTELNVGRIMVTRPGEIELLCDQEYYPALTQLLQGAKERIDISMFVFRSTSSPNNLPAKIAAELVAAGKRGVAVEVLLEHSGYDEDLNKEHRKLARTLRRGGVTVRFDSPETTTHSKIVLIDQRFSLLGSHNFTHSALRFNHECTLLVDNPVLNSRLREYIADIE